MDLHLEGKTALITGGSKGIGRAVAHSLTAEGARVMICARGEAALKSAATSSASSPPRARHFLPESPSPSMAG